MCHNCYVQNLTRRRREKAQSALRQVASSVRSSLQGPETRALRISAIMTRGNQRELAREKAAKKQKEIAKKKGASASEGNKGMTLEARKQRDADIMRQKQEKKAGEKAAAATGGQGTSGGKK